jgi:DNA-directed RNA polymerase subunit RPC12/RpoP
MMPPLLRRCPDCGFVGPSRRFVRAAPDVVACPVCGFRFETLDRPWLQ